MSVHSANKLIHKTIKKIRFKCAPALITIIGDSILPRDEKIWTSMLIDMAELFHIEERAVRTSIYRLAKDNWLQSFKQGRMSYYQLTPISTKRFIAVDKHLYSLRVLKKTHWCRVLLLDNKHRNKDKLQRELRWLGFGTLAGGTYLHPNGNVDTVKNIIKMLKMQDSTIIMGGEDFLSASAKALQKMGRKCWNLPELEKRCKQFIKIFVPFQKVLTENAPLSPAQAFTIRILVIHEYRRMMVHYPILPQELLPENWIWKNAYALCANIYKQTLPQSEKYITLLSQDIPIPMGDAHQRLYDRFPMHFPV